MQLSLATTLLVFLSSTADAFVLPSRRNGGRAFVNRRTIDATIYFPDDTEPQQQQQQGNANSWMYEEPEEQLLQQHDTQHNAWLYEEEPAAVASQQQHHNSWMYEEPEPEQPQQMALQHVAFADQFATPDKIGSLARMAAAYAPSGHGLNLQHIESVSIIGMDGRHIDIQAVVCQEEGCATVLVPVSFPVECDHDSDEEDCILMQLQTLDEQAGDLLQQMKNRDELEEERQRQWNELTSRETMEYPSWWQAPMQLIDECRNVQDLLNEPDFQQEIQGLAYARLRGLEHYDATGWTIDEATVVDISPSGLYIRARTNHPMAPSYHVFDLPIPFSVAATTVEDLRSAVLGMVASTTDETVYYANPVVEGVQQEQETVVDQPAVATMEIVEAAPLEVVQQEIPEPPQAAIENVMGMTIEEKQPLEDMVETEVAAMEIAEVSPPIAEQEIPEPAIENVMKVTTPTPDEESELPAVPAVITVAYKRRQWKSWSRKWKWSDQFRG